MPRLCAREPGYGEGPFKIADKSTHAIDRLSWIALAEIRKQRISAIEIQLKQGKGIFLWSPHHYCLFIAEGVPGLKACLHTLHQIYPRALYGSPASQPQRLSPSRNIRAASLLTTPQAG
jgi:hypothetical protein